MPNNIKLDPHVEAMQMCIKHLYEKCIYYFLAKLVDVIEYANGLVKKAEKKPPVFIKFESEEKFKAGEFTAMPVDIKTIQEVLIDLRKHPNITIIDKENIKPEPQLEFYFNDKLIMSGSVSDIKGMICKDAKTRDINPIFSIGDSFVLGDFPEKGLSTKVRIIKMTTYIKQSSNFPQYKYYLEKYP